ncbi:hypothetical protein ACJX0J_022088, partial [Zea mays]
RIRLSFMRSFDNPFNLPISVNLMIDNFLKLFWKKISYFVLTVFLENSLTYELCIKDSRTNMHLSLIANLQGKSILHQYQYSWLFLSFLFIFHIYIYIYIYTNCMYLVIFVKKIHAMTGSFNELNMLV